MYNPVSSIKKNNEYSAMQSLIPISNRFLGLETSCIGSGHFANPYKIAIKCTHVIHLSELSVL